MHTNLLSAQQIYAGESFKENGIFLIRAITKPHVKIPLIIQDEGSIVYGRRRCKTRLCQQDNLKSLFHVSWIALYLGWNKCNVFKRGLDNSTEFSFTGSVQDFDAWD